MDFGDALKAVIAGGRATRPDWGDAWINKIAANNTNLFVQGVGVVEPFPCIGFKFANNVMQIGWTPTQQDMLATDWSIV